jgi:tRNA nucleotidyltransferase (CCA-adding enzyme)
VRERLGRLVGDPDLTDLARIATRHRARVWIVGGALRDVILGREVPEVDVAVSGDADAIAHEMESRGGGRAVLLSGDRKPRVFRVAGRGRTVDVAEVEGDSIEMDLARRDFTANAMAVEVPSGPLLDPHAGLTDLSSGRLRMVSAKNLADDPLRAVRAARLFGTLGLAPDRETSRACRRTAPALARVAEERVQAELAKLLEAPRAAIALSWASANDLLGPTFRLAEVSDREWRRVARASAILDRPWTNRLSAERRRRLRLAFLAGEIGLSPREAASWLKRLRWGASEAEDVARLLGLVDGAARARVEEDLWRWILAAAERAPDALRLLEILRPRERSRARQLRARVARKPPIPDVRGADILEWLGIPPGPEVGRLLDAVRIEALAGRIRTRADARRWLRAQSPKSQVQSSE